MNTHTNLYKKLKEVVEKGDKFPTTSLDNHIAKLFLFDFEQSGIHLPEKERQLVVALNEYILQLGQRFSMGAHEPRMVEKQDLPPHIRYQYVPN